MILAFLLVIVYLIKDNLYILYALYSDLSDNMSDEKQKRKRKKPAKSHEKVEELKGRCDNNRSCY